MDKIDDLTEKEPTDLIKKIIENNGVYALMYIDVHSDSEDGVKGLMVELLTRMSKEEGVIYYIGKIGKPIKENNIVSATAEVKVLSKSLYYLDKIYARYTPLAIEILEPETIHLNPTDAAFILLESSNQAYQYSQYILKQSIGTEKYEKYLREIENRKILGKKLLEGAGEKNENKS